MEPCPVAILLKFFKRAGMPIPDEGDDRAHDHPYISPFQIHALDIPLADAGEPGRNVRYLACRLVNKIFIVGRIIL